MKKIGLTISFLFFTFFTALDSNSEEFVPKQKMSLPEIVSLALERNPQTRQAWLNIKVSEAQYKQTLSDYYPKVDLSTGYAASETDYKEDGVENTRAEAMTSEVSLSYLLFDFGEREASVSDFKHRLKSVKYDENSVMQNLVYSVIKAYYDLFSAISTQQATEETESSSLVAFNAASLRYKLGLVPLTDKLQSETAYAQSVLDRQKAQNQVKIAEGELNYLLNLEPDTNLDIEMPSLKVQKNPSEESIKNLMDIAIKQRPELLSKAEDKQSALSNIKSAKRQRYPSISLTSSYSRTDDRRSSNTDYDKSSIGLRATMPLFTGGDIKNQIAQSKREADLITSEITDLEKEIKLDVWKAYQNFETTKVIYKTSEKLLNSAKETERTTLGMYKNGKSSILDLLTAQSDLANAKGEFIFSQYSWFIARANLARAIGEGGLNKINK